MTKSDDHRGVSRKKAAMVKLLLTTQQEEIEKSCNAGASPPEYEGTFSESQERSTSRENKTQHDGRHQKKAGVIQEITAKNNSRDLSSSDPAPRHNHHDHKAPAQWSSSGEQADDEDSGPESIDSVLSSGAENRDKKESNLEVSKSSNEDESQSSHHQLKHDHGGAEHMRPKSAVSRSSSSSSGVSSEEEQFVVPENDFVVAIDDGYTVLPRVGASFRGRFAPGGGARMPPLWSPMLEQQAGASKDVDQPDVQNDSNTNDGSRRRKRKEEKS
jgi:hypothetical protein